MQLYQQPPHIYKAANPPSSGNNPTPLEKFAIERGLACLRDKMGNVLIRLPATAGYEQEPPILLQGHMDMVWAKDSTATIDLEKDPLELQIIGNCLKAKGTTLGADDGVAMYAQIAADFLI